MLNIKISENIVISDENAGNVQQSLANAVVTALIANPHVDLGADGVEVEITTVRPKAVTETYIGRAE